MQQGYSMFDKRIIPVVNVRRTRIDSRVVVYLGWLKPRVESFYKHFELNGLKNTDHFVFSCEVENY